MVDTIHHSAVLYRTAHFVTVLLTTDNGRHAKLLHALMHWQPKSRRAARKTRLKLASKLTGHQHPYISSHGRYYVGWITVLDKPLFGANLQEVRNHLAHFFHLSHGFRKRRSCVTPDNKNLIPPVFQKVEARRAVLAAAELERSQHALTQHRVIDHLEAVSASDDCRRDNLFNFISHDADLTAATPDILVLVDANTGMVGADAADSLLESRV